MYIPTWLLLIIFAPFILPLLYSIGFSILMIFLSIFVNDNTEKNTKRESNKITKSKFSKTMHSIGFNCYLLINRIKAIFYSLWF